VISGGKVLPDIFGGGAGTVVPLGEKSGTIVVPKGIVIYRYIKMSEY
jgi:hypothetical protein